MAERTTTGVIELTKHHAAGNDFLVQLDPHNGRQLSSEEVRALCERHRGLGADGVVRGSRSDTTGQLVMELRNADGSTAEMSGNGIRCLVQAAFDAGLVHPGDVQVQTLAGVRNVTYRPLEPGLGFATVDMGEVRLGAEFRPEVPPGAHRAVPVDVGNPHLVLECDVLDDETFRRSGELLSRSVTGGANVEFIRPGDTQGSIRLRVYERGAGETLACGTGACAAAAAARSWGLVGSEVDVVMPGGTLHVGVGDDHVVLGGPTRKIATISVSEEDLAALVAELALHDQGTGSCGESRNDDLVERV